MIINLESFKEKLEKTESLKCIFNEIKDKNNHPILSYGKSKLIELDNLVSKYLEILENHNNSLNSKMKDSKNFLNFIAELEWVYILSKVSKNIKIEPRTEEKSYDVESEILDEKIAFEVLTLNDSKEENFHNNIENVFHQISEIKSKFVVIISSISRDVKEPEAHKMKKFIIEKMNSDSIYRPTTFFYFGSNEFKKIEGYDGINTSSIRSIEEMQKLYELERKSRLRFSLIISNNSELHQTFVGTGHVGSGDDKYRLIERINSKRRQIPEDQKSIIVVKCKSFLQPCFYGDYISDGKISKKISAVVIYRNFNTKGEYDGNIYKNPNAKNPISDNVFMKLKNLNKK